MAAMLHQERSVTPTAASGEGENLYLWDEQEHLFDDDFPSLQTRASSKPPPITTTSEERNVMLLVSSTINNGDKNTNGNNMTHFDHDEAQPQDVQIGGGLEETLTLHFDHKTGQWKCKHCPWTFQTGKHWIDQTQIPKGHVHLPINNAIPSLHPYFTNINEGSESSCGSSLFEADPGYQELDNGVKENRPTTITDHFQNVHEGQLGTSFKPSEITPSEDVIIAVDETGQEFDVETVIRKQNTHDLFCPNCNSCITRRVILRKRKRKIQDIHHNTKRDKFEATVVPTNLDANIEHLIINANDDTTVVHNDDREPEVFRCLSCFSFFIPSAGREFKLFRCFGDWNDKQEMQNHQQSTAVKSNWFFSIFTSDKGEIAVDGDTRKSYRDVKSIEQLTYPLLSNDIEHQSENGHSVSPLASTKNVVSAQPAETANPKFEQHGKTLDKSSEIEAVDETQSDKIWPISSAEDEETIQLGDREKVTGFTSTETSISMKTSTVTYSEERSDDSVEANKTGDPVHSEVKVTKQWNSSLVSSYTQIPQQGTSIVVNSLLLEDNMSKPQLSNAKTDLAGYDISSSNQASSFLLQSNRIGEYVSDAIAQAENDMKSGDVASNQTPTFLKTTFTHSETSDNAVEIKKPEHVLIPVAEAEAVRRTKYLAAQRVTGSNDRQVLLESGTLTSVSEQGLVSGEEGGFDILKSIVYGGLIESITSLGVVTSAVGAGTSTLNIVALALANLIGGLFIVFHNLRELRKDNNVSASSQIGERPADRYFELLGRREKYILHTVVVVLSYIIFGLLPPIVYGFSFRKSGDKDYKLATVSVVSLICVIFLALGKGHVRRPKSYFKTLLYYFSLAIMASGLSYIVGILIEILLTKLDWLDSTSSSFVSTELKQHWSPY